jgi:hypothetical protein
LHVNGDVAAQSFINISTREAKKDIAYLSAEERTDALTALRGLKIARYHYSDEASTTPLRLGIIAEESPEEVLSMDGKGVDLYKLNALSLAGVQELSQKVTALESILGLSLAEIGSSTVETEGGNGLLAIILDGLRALGVSIRDGFVSFVRIFAEDIQTEELTAGQAQVGSAALPSGLQLYDEVTGEAYCVRIHNGEMLSTSGACDAPTAPRETVEPDPTPPEMTGGGTDTGGGDTDADGGGDTTGGSDTGNGTSTDSTNGTDTGTDATDDTGDTTDTGDTAGNDTTDDTTDTGTTDTGTEGGATDETTDGTTDGGDTASDAAGDTTDSGTGDAGTSADASATDSSSTDNGTEETSSASETTTS